MIQRLKRWFRRTRFYGDGVTIHSTTHLNVEVYEGRVVAVWFRCSMLPFEQSDVGKWRADDMRKYSQEDLPAIHGLELKP